MRIDEIYRESNVPNWCADLDENNLKSMWEKDGALYAIDTKSPYPLKKNFFSKSDYVFRLKYESSKGDIFYFVAVERMMPKFNESTFQTEESKGIHILKAAGVRDGMLEEISWRDDILHFQGSNDPMYKCFQGAKKYEQKDPPDYFSYVD